MNPEVFEKICDEIATGNPNITDTCTEYHVSSQSFWKEIRENESSAKLYARAKEFQQDASVERIRNIELRWKEEIDSCDDPKRIHGINAFYAKLIDNIKWEAAHRKPKVFGDSITQKLADSDGNNLQVVFNVPRPKKEGEE